VSSELRESRCMTSIDDMLEISRHAHKIDSSWPERTLHTSESRKLLL
jgi:hypothetical protein